MATRLRQVEGEVAELAGERRATLRLMVAGHALFLFGARVPKELDRKDGTKTRILRFALWSPKGGRVWCEVRDDLIERVLSLGEGDRVRVAGQLFIDESERVMPPRTFVTVRVYELERVE